MRRDDVSCRLQYSHVMLREIANLYFPKKSYNYFYCDIFHLNSISDVGGKKRKSRFREVRCVYCVCKKKKILPHLNIPSCGLVVDWTGGKELDWCSLPGPHKVNCMFLSLSSSLNPRSRWKRPEWTFSSIMHYVIIIFSDKILHSTQFLILLHPF